MPLNGKRGLVMAVIDEHSIALDLRKNLWILAEQEMTILFHNKGTCLARGALI